MSFFPSGFFPSGFFPSGFFPEGAEVQPSTAVPLWAMPAILRGRREATMLYQFPIGDERPLQPIYLTAGDETGQLLLAPKDNLGNAVPFADGAVVTFVMRKVGEAEAALSASGSVSRSHDGKMLLLFEFSPSNPVPASGTYNAVFLVDGMTFPIGRRLTIIVQSALA